MKISVIIPVYNAEKQIVDTVHSVLDQKYVSEIILVEDGSKDNSLEVCNEIASGYDLVKIFQHPDGKNLGAGPTRNLGVHMATSDYIAFLDADDKYNHDRFLESISIINDSKSVDGVYEATEIIVDSKEYAESEALKHIQSKDGLITLDSKVFPEKLFDALVIQGKGFFHLNGLLIKKDCFLKVGGFADLRLSQDINLIVKLSLMANLYPGNLTKPVAQYILHGFNRAIADKETTVKYRIDMWDDLIKWAKNNQISAEKVNMFKIKKLIDLLRVKNFKAFKDCIKLLLTINPYYYFLFLYIRYSNPK